MYQIVVSSETIPSLVTKAKKYLRLLNNTAEDDLITDQITVAIRNAEKLCNRAFMMKSVVIKSDNFKFNLLGIIDTTKTITCKIDGVVTTDYTIKGDVQPEIEFMAFGDIYQIEYTTKADLPIEVEQWVYQKTAQQFERNSEDSREPDAELLEPYKNIVWLQ